MERTYEEQILLYEELYQESPPEDATVKQAKVLFRKNINLAYYIAKKFYSYESSRINIEDIRQQALLGLWESCLNYDESKGFAFSTYAVSMIKGSIYTMLRRDTSVKMPRWYQDIKSYVNIHSIPLPLSEEDINKIYATGRFSMEHLMLYEEIDIVSLDANASTEIEDSKLSDLIEDPKQELAYQLSDTELEAMVDALILYAPKRYKHMLEEWMYMVLADEKINLKNLATKYGHSQETIRRAIKHMREMILVHKDEVLKILGK